MDDASLKEKILYLLQVEKLTRRQTLCQLHIGHHRLKRLLGEKITPGKYKKPSILKAYCHLLEEWYRQYPRLKALQIYQRIKDYGYTGSLSSVQRFTRPWRIKKPVVYHALDFIAGEEAQVDWFFADLENVGRVALFLYVLSFSRYAFGRFYPKTSFEFFLSGHLECFEHLKGLAHTHRYDNLKSVVLKHTPQIIEYNPQFLEFARHYSFKIHACNPYKGNEKGRVERLGRDVRSSFLYGQVFKDALDLNERFREWLTRRNKQIHRSTGKMPIEMLGSENLLNKTPLFKHQRILKLVESLDPVFYKFLRAQGDDETERLECAYQIFKLLKAHNRSVLVSAVAELLSMGTYKIKAVYSLLNLPLQKDPDAVFPSDQKLLDIRYQERSLEEYDKNN